jgi:hypothetical protein
MVSTVQTSANFKEDLNAVLLFFKGPSHPFKKRNKIFYQTVAAITFLLSVIVFFMHEWILIGVILSVAFVIYVISTVPPIDVEHKFTPLGVENAGAFYRWIELYAFWFEKKWDYEILVLQTRLPMPAQLRIVLKDTSKDKVKDIIGKYLLYYENPPKSFIDNVSDWFSTKFPLEPIT